jgi:hypothetical protein
MYSVLVLLVYVFFPFHIANLPRQREKCNFLLKNSLAGSGGRGCAAAGWERVIFGEGMGVMDIFCNFAEK